MYNINSMSSLLDAMAKVGLATENEKQAQESEEAKALREKQAALLPKKPWDLASREGYDFFAKVAWLVEYIEADAQATERIVEVRDFVEARMLHGLAGKEFLLQLDELNTRLTTIAAIKAKWPKIWKP